MRIKPLDFMGFNHTRGINFIYCGVRHIPHTDVWLAEYGDEEIQRFDSREDALEYLQTQHTNNIREWLE